MSSGATAAFQASTAPLLSSVMKKLLLVVLVHIVVVVMQRLPGANAEPEINKDFKVISEWAQAQTQALAGGMRNYNRDGIPWITTAGGDDYQQTSVFAFRESGAETRWILEPDLGLSAEWDVEYDDLGEIMRAFHQWGASHDNYISAFPTFRAQVNSFTGFRELEAVAILNKDGSYVDESFPAFNSATAYERFREVDQSAPSGTVAFPVFVNTLSFQTVVVVDSTHIWTLDLPIPLLNHLKLAHWMTSHYVARSTPTQPMSIDNRNAIIRQQTKAVRSLDLCSALITRDQGTLYRDKLLKTYDQVPIIYSNLIAEPAPFWSPFFGSTVCAPPGTNSTGGRQVNEHYYKLEFIRRDRISIGDLLSPPPRQSRSKRVLYRSLIYVLICPTLYSDPMELGRTTIHETMHAAGENHTDLTKEGRRNCTNIAANSPYFQTAPLRAECCMDGNKMTLTSAFDDFDYTVDGGEEETIFPVSSSGAVGSIGLPATQQASDLPQLQQGDCGCALLPSEWENQTMVEVAVDETSVQSLSTQRWVLDSDGISSNYSFQITTRTSVPGLDVVEFSVSAHCQIDLPFQEIAENQDCKASSLPYAVSGCTADGLVDPAAFASDSFSFLVDGSAGVLSQMAVDGDCQCLEIQDDLGASTKLCRPGDYSPSHAPSTGTSAPPSVPTITTQPSPSNNQSEGPTSSNGKIFEEFQVVGPIGSTNRMTIRGSNFDVPGLLADSPALLACGPPILLKGSKIAVYRIDESTAEGRGLTCLAVDTFGSTFDTVLGILTGPDSQGNLRCLVEDDDTDGLQSQIDLALLNPGTTNYWLFVAGYAYLSGNYTLNFSIQDCPSELPSISPSPSTTPTSTPRDPPSTPTTGAPTKVPVTGSPTGVPTTGAPTSTPTTGTPTKVPVTGSPTGVPSTGTSTSSRVPTSAPFSSWVPTSAPTTGAPTSAPSSSDTPTSAPSTGAPTRAPSTSPTPTTTPLLTPSPTTLPDGSSSRRIFGRKPSIILTTAVLVGTIASSL